MRNACVRHAAARLGLEVPGTRELATLADDTSLGDAVAWWQAEVGVAAAEPERATGRPVLLRAVLLRVAVVTAVTVLGLALSYRPVQ